MVEQYVAAMFGGVFYVRKETRLRMGKNEWIYDTLVLPFASEWLQTLLPSGKRTLCVRWTDGQLYFFNREGAIVSKKPSTTKGPPFICECVGYLIYDMIAWDTTPLIGLPLAARMEKAPGAPFVKAAYVPLTPTFKCADSQRVILIKKESPYTNHKDVLSLKPQLRPGLAVLACRCGQACSLANEYLLKEEGSVINAPKQLAAYVCRWYPSEHLWRAIREAKRGAPIFTATQCFMCKAGVKQPDFPFDDI